MANKVLVAVFSASGVTRKVGQEVARVAGGDFFEIEPVDPYTRADLNWTNRKSRSSVEMNDSSARPEVASKVSDMDRYDTVIVGFPIWWGVAPRIMDTFVESYDFTGITLIPFCTSGSSGIGQSGSNLETNAGTGTWLEGKRFAAGASDAEIEEWIAGLY